MPSFVSQVNYQRMAETIAIPPSSPSPAPAANPGKRFEGEGLPFKAKLIGMEDLNVDRDEKVCLDSMFKLKAVVKARGEHKQRIQLNLTINGVKLTDDTTKVLIANHEIERISFVVIDPRDTRAFGYIYNTTDDRHQFWAIKTEKSAAATVLAMKDLFDYAFEIYNDPKNKTETPSTPAKTVDPEPTPAPAPVPTTADVFNTPVLVDEPKPAPVVERKEESIIDIFGSDDPPVLNPSATTSHAGLIQPLWDDPEPVAVPAPAPPSASIDPLEDLFNNLASPSAPLTNPVPPISNSLFNPSAQMNVMSPSITPTPLFPSTTTSNPPLFPSISTPSVNSFPTSPTSPVAPPTVLNPLLDLDIFGGAGTSKTTKDAFFPTQPAKQPLAQMQNERRA